LRLEKPLASQGARGWTDQAPASKCNPSNAYAERRRSEQRQPTLRNWPPGLARAREGRRRLRARPAPHGLPRMRSFVFWSACVPAPPSIVCSLPASITTAHASNKVRGMWYSASRKSRTRSLKSPRTTTVCKKGGGGRRETHAAALHCSRANKLISTRVLSHSGHKREDAPSPWWHRRCARRRW